MVAAVVHTSVRHLLEGIEFVGPIRTLHLTSVCMRYCLSTVALFGLCFAVFRLYFVVKCANNRHMHKINHIIWDGHWYLLKLQFICSTQFGATHLNLHQFGAQSLTAARPSKSIFNYLLSILPRAIPQYIGIISAIFTLPIPYTHCAEVFVEKPAKLQTQIQLMAFEN